MATMRQSWPVDHCCELVRSNVWPDFNHKLKLKNMKNGWKQWTEKEYVLLISLIQRATEAQGDCR